MALIVTNLIKGLENMPEDVDAPGDSIGVEITKFTDSLIPLVNPSIKSNADKTLIKTLNQASSKRPRI